MDSQSYLPSLNELKKIRKPIRNINAEYKGRLSGLEKFAIWITEHIGTMGFFIIIFFWILLWLGWNTIGPADYRFDPFPAFVLWLFISNMIQLLLLPLIMLGQNLQSRHAAARAEEEFDVNMKAEREIEAVLGYLEHQNELFEKVAKRLEER